MQVLPPGWTSGAGNVVRGVQVGEATNVAPEGMFVVYLSTVCAESHGASKTGAWTGPKQSANSLETAMAAATQPFFRRIRLLKPKARYGPRARVVELTAVVCSLAYLTDAVT